MKIPENTQYILFGGTFVLANKLQFIGDKSVEGLSVKQWFLLRNLRDMPQNPPPTITQIAAETDSTRQNITKMLESMEREGLVTIEKSDADLRSRIVQITPEGLTSAVRTAENSKGFFEDLFEGIKEEECAAASRVLIKMIQNLEKMKEGILYENNHSL